MLDYKTRAIVLKSYRLSESDKILHLYSQELGPLQVVAKGAYKLESKFAAKTQILNCLDLLLAEGKNLDIVKEANLHKSFSNIHSSYEALTYACFMADIIQSIAINDDHYSEIYNLINEYLGELNTLSKIFKDQELCFIACKYLWELIYIMGYKPELNTCSINHKRRDANQIPQYFDFANGSITSTNAFRDHLSDNPYQDSIRELKPGVFKILNFLDLSKIYAKPDTDVNSSLAMLEQLNAIVELDKSIVETLKFLHKHLEYRIHKEFKSWKLVEQILSSSYAKAA